MSAPGQDTVGSQHSKECKSAHPACLERLRGTAPSSSELPWLAGSCWHCRHLTWQRGIFWLDCSTDLCVVLSSGTDLCFQLDACWKMRLFFLLFYRAGSTTVVDKVTDPWLYYCGIKMLWVFSSILEIRLLCEHWTVHNLECVRTHNICVPADESISLCLFNTRYLSWNCPKTIC